VIRESCLIPVPEGDDCCLQMKIQWDPFTGQFVEDGRSDAVGRCCSPPHPPLTPIPIRVVGSREGGAA
jgi:hypothetical protein